MSESQVGTPAHVYQRFLGTADGKRVYLVNGDAVKLHWEMDFIEGGNGWRYSFIPKGEVWLDGNTNPADRRYILYHELFESRLMKEGLSYEHAHLRANGVERVLREQQARPVNRLKGLVGTRAGADRSAPADASNTRDIRSVGVLKAPRLRSYLTKAEGTCKPGQTAATTGCTPESGGGGKKPSTPSESPDHPARQAVLSAFHQTAAKYADAKATAKRFAGAGFGKLPPKVQGAITRTYGAAKYAEHKLMTGFRAAKQLAEAVAKERGMSPEDTARLARVLAIADGVAAWTVNMPVAYAATGSKTAAKVASWIPVASLAYIGYSAARNPFKTSRAAKAFIQGAPKGKAMKKSRSGKALGAALADALEKAGEHVDWFMALYGAALDVSEGDAAEALARAQQAFKEHPKPPWEVDADLSEEDADFLPDGRETEEKPVNRLKGYLPKVSKGRGTCKPGQTAANTGCTPASGDGGKSTSTTTDTPGYGGLSKVEHVNVADEAKVRGEVERLKKKHPVPVSTSSSKVDPAREYAAHRVLASLPKALKKALGQMGVTVKIVHGDDEPHESFMVGDQKFTKAGHANYSTGEIKIWADVRRSLQDESKIVAHETGHFAVQAFMRLMAKAEDSQEALKVPRRQAYQAMQDYGLKYEAEHGEWPKREGNEEYARLEAEYQRTKKEQQEAEDLRGLAMDLGEATREEGGVTPYADSYAKNQERGWRSDVWQYTGEPESEDYQRYRKNNPDVGPRASISRASNENFAEMTAAMMLGHIYGRMDEFKAIKKSHPKVFKAYERLWKLVSKMGDVPEGKTV